MQPRIEQEPTSAFEAADQGSSTFPMSGRVGNTYRLLRKIGAGASSVVYEAEHVRLGKRFAVKILRSDLEPHGRTAQRFRREAGAIALLSSEHIVSVVDCGELADQTPYIVMELLDGEDLRSLLKRERTLPARRAVPIAMDACRGLALVHQAGLVHRDIKPENLFITRRSDGSDLCKVLDLGVVKMESDFATAEGTVLGTVRYMAPEQLAGSSAVGPAVDIYALGAVLYECLTGEPLVTGSTVQEVMYRTLNVEPTPLLTLQPSLPRRLTSLVDSCVRKVATERPASATELVALLDGIIVDPVGTSASWDTLREGRVSTQQPGSKAPRFGRGTMLAGAIAACVGAFSAGWWLRGREEPPPSAARLPPVRERRREESAASSAPAPPIPAPPAPSAAFVPQAPVEKASPPRSIKRRREAPAPPSGTGPFDSFNPYGE